MTADQRQALKDLMSQTATVAELIHQPEPAPPQVARFRSSIGSGDPRVQPGDGSGELREIERQLIEVERAIKTYLRKWPP